MGKANFSDEFKRDTLVRLLSGECDKLLGYEGVPTEDQNLRLERAALIDAG